MRLALVLLVLLGLLLVLVGYPASEGDPGVGPGAAVSERDRGLLDAGGGEEEEREDREERGGERSSVSDGEHERVAAASPEVDARSPADDLAQATDVTEPPELSRIHVHHSGRLVGAAVSAATEVAATLGEEGTIGLWDLAKREFLRTIEPEEPSGQAICFTQQGRLLVQACRDGAVALWDPRSGERVGTFRGHRSEVRSLSSSGSGLVASVSVDDTLVVWELSSLKELWRRGLEDLPFSHGNAMLEAIFTFDGTSLFGLTKHGVVIWSARDGRGAESMDTFRVPRTTIRPLAFSARGGAWALYYATGPEDDPGGRSGVLTVGAGWLREGMFSPSLNAHERICALDFSDDGTLLAAGADDGSVEVWKHMDRWEEEACESARIDRFHEGRILCVEFLAGPRLVSISTDNLICIVNELL